MASAFQVECRCLIRKIRVICSLKLSAVDYQANMG